MRSFVRSFVCFVCFPECFIHSLVCRCRCLFLFVVCCRCLLAGFWSGGGADDDVSSPLVPPGDRLFCVPAPSTPLPRELVGKVTFHDVRFGHQPATAACACRSRGLLRAGRGQPRPCPLPLRPAPQWVGELIDPSPLRDSRLLCLGEKSRGAGGGQGGPWSFTPPLLLFCPSGCAGCAEHGGIRCFFLVLARRYQDGRCHGAPGWCHLPAWNSPLEIGRWGGGGDGSWVVAAGTGRRMGRYGGWIYGY